MLIESAVPYFDFSSSSSSYDFSHTVGHTLRAAALTTPTVYMSETDDGVSPGRAVMTFSRHVRYCPSSEPLFGRRFVSGGRRLRGDRVKGCGYQRAIDSRQFPGVGFRCAIDVSARIRSRQRRGSLGPGNDRAASNAAGGTESVG